MNGQSRQQFSIEPQPSRADIFDGGGAAGVQHLQAVISPEAFLFGPFSIVPRARLLKRHGSAVALSSRAFDVLCLLVSRAGEVVSKSELIAKAWPGVAVEESTLRFHIAQLRRSLGDGRENERYVVNVSGRGYCFVANVRRQESPLEQCLGAARWALL